MRYGDEGEQVRRMQVALEAAGYDLPRYGPDGDFGSETRMALYRFSLDQGQRWAYDEPVPEAILDALGVGEIPDEPETDPGECPPDLDGVPILDLRHEALTPHPKSRVRNGKTVLRGVGSIDAIVLHQTAVKFGRVGDRSDLALARRSLRVACHAMAFHDGFVALPADLRAYIYHADRLNSRSLGLEVDGNYPGLIGGPSTNDRDVTPVTEAVVRAACAGVRLLVTEGAKIGIEIKRIYVHRQADAWRRADPGQELYQRVVLDYAVPVLGLEHDPAETFRHPKTRSRDGWPVPRQWNPDAGVGAY